MIKLIITILLPFIAPMIAYSLWQKIIMAKQKNRLRKNTLAWCFLVGTILAALSLFIFGLPKQTDGLADELGNYQPPVLQDGKVVPGRFYD